MTSRPASLLPTAFERLLGVGAFAMLAVVLTALVRGHAHWPEVPAIIWLHLATIITALALTPVLLFDRRGTARHRLLGWIWAVAMFGTALLSLGIRLHGHFSLIHILSVVTILTVPMLVMAARRHDVAVHRRIVRSIVTGALLIAGVFTLPFGRMLGQWLFG